MDEYIVYLHEKYGYRIITNGISGLGLLFWFPWLMIKGLYIRAFFILFLYFLAIFCWIASRPYYYQPSLTPVFLGWFGIAIFVGCAGNGWVGKKLESKGFRNVGKIEAENEDEAHMHAYRIYSYREND